MRLKVLGTQSPYNTKGHNCPGFFLQDGNDRLLLDCGSGSHSLLTYPVDLQNLSVIVTHLHRDHYNDIYNLLYTSAVFHDQKRIEKPIEIYLPQTPAAIVTDISNEKNAFAKYHEINAEKTIHIGNMKINFCRTDHGVETYAIKIQNGSKTIVYTSDTSYSAKDRIAAFAQNADLLICESSLLKEHGFPEINAHLTAEQAGRIAKSAHVKQLALTHFWPEEDPQKYVAEAGKIFANVMALNEEQIIDVEI
ncbi:MAG: MBL fold metallo-hydrolase [Firmicutes bacterium]|nr:MBL fold metallo-hydrolase [Bacillota bacterium]